MHSKNEKVLMAFGLAALLLACGCGEKRIETSEVPKQPGASENAGMGKASLAASGHYFVEKHDCLWAIAGKPRIYGDSFQWPELFKANRDQIQDPDLIYPRQDLRVEKGFSLEEINNAKRMASATPKYVPHSKPRETLPVDYF
jgi:hypothetical protein